MTVRTAKITLLLAGIISVQLEFAPVQRSAGMVVGVIDGSFMRVILDGRPEEIRLNDFDYPEKGQRFRNPSKEGGKP